MCHNVRHVKNQKKPEAKRVTINARIPKDLYDEFLACAMDEEERDNDSLLLRRALRVFIDSRDPKKVRAAELKKRNEEAI